MKKFRKLESLIFHANKILKNKKIVFSILFYIYFAKNMNQLVYNEVIKSYDLHTIFLFYLLQNLFLSVLFILFILFGKYRIKHLYLVRINKFLRRPRAGGAIRGAWETCLSGFCFSKSNYIWSINYTGIWLQKLANIAKSF